MTEFLTNFFKQNTILYTGIVYKNATLSDESLHAEQTSHLRQSGSKVFYVIPPNILHNAV